MRAQVDRSLAAELEFDKILELVAAHARTRVGRCVVRDLGLESIARSDPAATAL